MELTVTIEIPRQALMDLLTTAYEGGSDHWIGDYDPRPARDAESRIEVITFLSEEGDEGEPLQINPVIPDALGAAIQKALNRTVQVSDSIIEDLRNNLDDIGMCDAATADAILQIACFDSIVYD